MWTSKLFIPACCLMSLLSFAQLFSSNSFRFMVGDSSSHQWNSSTRNKVLSHSQFLSTLLVFFTCFNLNWFFLEEPVFLRKWFSDAWDKGKYEYPHSSASKWSLPSAIKHSPSTEHGLFNSLVLYSTILIQLGTFLRVKWKTLYLLFISPPIWLCSHSCFPQEIC